MDIRIENLSKRYGPQKAVDQVSFEVKTGEILGFLGPNGAGKSTTMKMITGYIGIGGGEVLIGEKSVQEHGDELKTHILPEVEATCDRILIINKGKIVANGTPESLRKLATGQEIVKIRIEDGPSEEILHELRRIKSIDLVDVTDRTMNRFELQSRTGSSSKREVFQLCVEKGWVLTELIPIETRLEDIFRNLTTN